MYSIVIPLYNKERSVASTIESVLKQSISDFELIIVNDGSTDSSLYIVNSIKDPRIRIINKRNQGVSSARNVGIRASKGVFVAFLDADDLWDRDYLTVMDGLIMDFPNASVYCCKYSINSIMTDESALQNRINRGTIDDYFASSSDAPLFQTSGVIVKRQCFNEVGYFNTKLVRGEDREMWIRLAKKYLLAYEPTALVVYNLNSENRACSNTPPLDSFYYETRLFGRSKYEKKYFLKFAEIILLEMFHSKKYYSMFVLLLKYNLYTPRVLFNILSRRIGLKSFLL